MGGLGLKMYPGGGCGGGGRVPEADAALNCSVPEWCIKYASDRSYAATITDDFHGFS